MSDLKKTNDSSLIKKLPYLLPIVELETSAKNISIVLLLKGWCIYETGLGRSASKYVHTFVEYGPFS